MLTKHFSHLLGQVPIVDHMSVDVLNMGKLPIETGAFTIEELMISIRSMSKSKSSGLDDILAEA